MFGTTLVLAPLAGGPGRPELVAAVGDAGGFGFLPAGYRAAADVMAEVQRTRSLTDAGFGVNVFVPGPDRVDEGALAAYLEEIGPEAERLGVDLGPAVWDDDDWPAKVDALVADPVAVVSFTFGCPPAEVVRELRRAGSTVVVTVTSAAEARAAQGAGADGVCVQGIEAGGHQGAFEDRDPGPEGALASRLASVRRAVDLPITAAGGITTAADVAAALAAGASSVQLGTAFLRSAESGASEVHKAALATGERTALTRAFSGRTARGVANRFMADHPDAPSAYPHVNSATKALRRESARRGEPDAVNLWAGTGFRHAQADDAGTITDRLLTELRRLA
ncbi:MAG TPA: nitronate monooxygenase [Acidimicrobiales bacterium]|nr:nitronate monooxygenase [Acidimicrobiales bacterium]